MALRSIIHKAALAISDIDHGYYADHELTLARHPSETNERMMIRLLALALNAHELNDRCGGDGTLAFGAGLSDPDDPDLWLKDFSGVTRLWVEVGQPEDRPLVKACGKADVVRVYCFHHAADVWWKRIESKLTRLDKLEVFRVPANASLSLASLADRSMQLQALIQDGSLTLSNSTESIQTQLERLR